jgi:S-adenosylmethionine decarboxylase proenzyme
MDFMTIENKEHSTQSQHMLLDVWLSKAIDQSWLEDIISKVKDQFTVVGQTSHSFDPQGETIVLILAESHFTIHTYPEHNYLSMDLYICNTTIDLSIIKNLILQDLPISKINEKIMLRGF